MITPTRHKDQKTHTQIGHPKKKAIYHTIIKTKEIRESYEKSIPATL